MYGSAPSRGLQQLLQWVWPLVYHAAWEQFQLRVRLKVFYGFPPSVVLRMRKDMGADAFEAWHAYMMELLSQPGVEYVGAVDHLRLSEEYAAAGFILYPSKFPETGCITIIKAMSCGAIPITSRYSQSVLPNVTGHFDLGPAKGLTPEDVHAGEAGEGGGGLQRWMANEYVGAVLAAINSSALPDAVLGSMREEMKKEVRKTRLWSGSATNLAGMLQTNWGLFWKKRRKWLWW